MNKKRFVIIGKDNKQQILLHESELNDFKKYIEKNHKQFKGKVYEIREISGQNEIPFSNP